MEARLTIERIRPIRSLVRLRNVCGLKGAGRIQRLKLRLLAQGSRLQDLRVSLRKLNNLFDCVTIRLLIAPFLRAASLELDTLSQIR